MGQQCQFLEKCPMFEYFCRAAKEIYRYAYCEGNYDNCERRKRRLSGETVPQSMLPQGSYLWDEQAGEKPPMFWLS